MPGRPRTASNAAILAATARALGRVGPSRLTLAHVAAEVGLAPATLIQRFGSKRELLLAFTATGADDLVETFAAVRRAADSPLEALVAALIDLTRGIDTPEALANYLSFRQADLGDGEFREQALTQSRAMREEIRELLDEAVRAGELVRLQSARVARAVQTTYAGSLATWAVAPEGTLEDWLREDLDLMLQPYKPL
jgi:AcrR family transcriptional regulator